MRRTIGGAFVGEGLYPSRSVYGSDIDRSFVGADDSVGPIGNGTAIVRADRVVRPYGRSPEASAFIVRRGVGTPPYESATGKYP